MILCITNFVAAEITANAVLASGERPFMCNAVEEIREAIEHCNALLVNIGTVDKAQAELMTLAVEMAKNLNKPWVLDPVGIQLTGWRQDVMMSLLKIYRPLVIKGNGEEMKFLSEETKDKDESCIFVTTGETDIIRKGEKQETVLGGSRMMTKVTGMGCALGGVIAARLAGSNDYYSSVLETLRLFKKAGENAEVKCGGSGSFKTIFIDELCRLSETISCN